MEGDIPSMECEECGGTNFYKETGHFYCSECQTQSQQVREHVFEQETINKKSARKIQNPKETKRDEQLTSWECYNYVLKGLTNELLGLGAKPELKLVVQCLWMKYLHKCEVFQLHNNDLPKINIFGSKKDIAVLYNLKKRKRRKYSTGSTSARRERSRKMKALVQSQYQELSQSQSLDHTQESLASIKDDLASSNSSAKMTFNKFTKQLLCEKMSKNHMESHRQDLEGDLTCHQVSTRNLSTHMRVNPTNLTSYVLYELLYIGLLIVRDPIQLGDLLRFLKEGHLSFACYRHFLPEDLTEKSLNLPQRRERLFCHAALRQRCAKMVHFLDIARYVTTPDLKPLCVRYCKELQLPEVVGECVGNLLEHTKPKMSLKDCKWIPNYEGRAMSLVVFTLKLLFGLDGVTEKKLSEYCQLVNNLELSNKMFNFLDWLELIKMRRQVMQQQHLPSVPPTKVTSDLYLNYIKNQKGGFKGFSGQTHGEIKDYLTVLDRLLPEEREEELFFEPTLTPYHDYFNLLSHNLTVNQDFKNTSLDYLFHPQTYLQALGTYKIQHKGANDCITVQPYLHLYNNNKTQKTTTAVRITSTGQDKHITEYLTETPSKDAEVLQSNWAEFYQSEFQRHQPLIGELLPSKTEILYPHHYQPFQRHWLNLPLNHYNVYLSQQLMEELSDKWPAYFREVVEEGARVVEQEPNDFYGEFLTTELYLANFDFGRGVNKDEKNGVIEIRSTLKSIRKHW